MLHYNGTGWAPVGGIPQVALRDVWAAAADNVWTVGRGGAAFHFDGKLWTKQDTRVTQDLNGVWGYVADDLWIVGSNGIVLHHNGSEFSAPETPTDQTLLSVWGTASGTVFVAGVQGTVLRYQDGWSVMHSGSQASLSRIAGTVRSASDGAADAMVLWAVGANGTLLRSDGTAWTAIDSNSDSWFAGVWVSSDHSAWFAGTDSAISRFMPAPPR